MKTSVEFWWLRKLSKVCRMAPVLKSKAHFFKDWRMTQTTIKAIAMIAVVAMRKISSPSIVHRKSSKPNLTREAIRWKM